MSMQNVSNHKQLLLGKKDISSALAAGQIATPSLLEDGEVVITTLDGVVVTSAQADTTELVVVQGQGSTLPLIKSAPFTTKSLLNIKKKAYAVANQQASYIGYAPGKVGAATPGTTGSIELPAVGTSVILRNTFKTNFYQFSDKLVESIVGYKITAATTTSTLVDYLTKYAIQDVQKYVNIPYSVERVNSLAAGSVTALTGTATSITFTKGSAVATINGTITNASLVGSYMRVGSTAVASPVYKITAYTASSTITLDVPFQGANATVLVANAPLITPVTTSGTDGVGWGIRFTGRVQTRYGVNTFRYETSKFVTTAQNFGLTTVKDAFSTGTGSLDSGVPTEGSGEYMQMADEEYFFQLFEGMHDSITLQIPPVTMRSNVSTTGTYSIVDLEFATQAGTMSFINNPVGRKQIRTAFDVSAGTTEYDLFVTTFNTVTGLTLA